MAFAVTDEKLAQRVGAILLAVVFAAAIAVVLLDGAHLRPGTTVHVMFGHTGNLREGADVQIAGRVVGELKAIRLVSARDAAEPSHPLHPGGGVVCDVRIEDRYLWMALDNGEIFVAQKGLIGTGFLEIGPPANSGEAPGKPLKAGAVLRGVDPPQVDRVLQRSYQNLLVSKIFLAEVSPIAHELMSEIDKLRVTLSRVETTPGSFSDMLDSLGALRIDIARTRSKWDSSDLAIEDLRAVAAHGRKTLEGLRQATAELEARADELSADLRRIRAAVPKGLQDRVDAAIAESYRAVAKLQRIRATLEGLAAMVARGDGNIGGLLNDPEFSDYAKKIGKALKRTPWKIFATERD